MPPFLLSSCLLGVMAQRLLRRVCSRCAGEVALTQDQLLALGAPLPLLPGGVQIMQGAGCVHCRGTGYYGRTGVFEIMAVTPEMREAIATGAGTPELVGAGAGSGDAHAPRGGRPEAGRRPDRLRRGGADDVQHLTPLERAGHSRLSGRGAPSIPLEVRSGVASRP